MKETETGLLVPHIDVLDVLQEGLQHPHLLSLYARKERVHRLHRVRPDQIPEGDIKSEKGSVADLDPGSGSGMNKPDHIFESLETIFWVKILKFFDADQGSGMEKIRIRNTGYR